MNISFWGQGLTGLAVILSIIGFLNIRYRRYFMFAVFLTVMLSYALFTYAHVVSDFSLLNVFLHSHSQEPLIYRIVGTWGSHEGSMLLWILCLSFHSVIFIRTFCHHEHARYYCLMIAGFLLFSMIACDPFASLAQPARQGLDLNPSLQDPSLVIHPPFLYLGLTGLSLPFVAVLSQNSVTDKMVLYQLTLFSWVFITIGIALGSFWAYYELGWGGYWYWDPVENVALMPWLGATALIHVLKQNMSSDKWFGQVSFFSGISFSLCLVGLFLVRSGLLQSVHSFAVDTEKGIVLGLLVLFILIPAWFIIVRSHSFHISKLTFALSKDNFLSFQSIYLLFGILFIFVGTMGPVLSPFFHVIVSLDASFFNGILIPLFIPFFVLMMLVPFCVESPMPYKVTITFVILGLACYVLCVWTGGEALHGLYLSLLVIGLCMTVYALRFGKGTVPFVLSHSGFLLMGIGVCLNALFSDNVDVQMKKDTIYDFHGYKVCYKGVTSFKTGTYDSTIAYFQVNQQQLHPEIRQYHSQKNPHDETSFKSFGLHNIYIVLGEFGSNDHITIRLGYKAYVNLIWLGVILMIIGGAIRLAKRKVNR